MGAERVAVRERLPVVARVGDYDTRADRIARSQEGPEICLEGDPQRGDDEVIPAAVRASAAGTTDLAGIRFVGAQRARATALSSFIGPSVQPPLWDRTGPGTDRGVAAYTRAGRGQFILHVMSDSLTLTAVFTPDENGWTMAQLAEWPAVVTCGRTVEEARAMLLDAAREMIASYHDEGREPPIGGGHVEPITIDLAA